jgi:hypothetical protein
MICHLFLSRHDRSDTFFSSTCCYAQTFTQLAGRRFDCYNPKTAILLKRVFCACGQVAQLVERSPEKAGVGGSTPSLATMFSII